MIQTIQVLREKDITITNEMLVKGVQNVSENTGLKGRWQILQHDPLVICDSGHNVDGIREVVRNLQALKQKKIHFVLGMVNDKDIGGILKLLPDDSAYYFCKANIPRGLDAAILAKQAAAFGLKGMTFSSVRDAYEKALANCKHDEMVFIGGSIFVVAEIL